jgi:alpha-galactosidase
MADNTFVLIGAGSTVFTPGLLRDLSTSKTFDDFTIRLVDLNREAAETMTQLGRRIAEHAGSNMRVEAYNDRRQALPGARFVATTIAVGSAAGWYRDIEIPAAYGIQQTVGDSVGPGGVLRALRHSPELVAIARDIEELAPDAQLINYSNPLTANVRAVRKYTNVNAVGLCHGTMHTKGALARDLGLEPDEVHAVFAGVNHLCWLMDIRTGSEDLYPRLRELVTERAGAKDAPSSREEGVHAAVSADLMHTFGLYPAPGDRHTAEFFGDYLSLRPAGELEWGLQGGKDATLQYIGEKVDLWDGLRAQASGAAPLDVGGNQEAERLVSIADALMTGTDRLELAVNMPNDGKIPNLPSSAVVEVPAVIGAAGITGLAVGRLPDGIAAVLTARAEQQELIVDAAILGSRTLAIQALVLDPLVPSSQIARSILDDAVAADPEHLQRFA